jgi:hypothetical protein
MINTGRNISINLMFPKAQHLPTSLFEFGVALCVLFLLARQIVPVIPIAFDDQLALWNSEVRPEVTNSILGFVADTAPIQFGSHRDFNGRSAHIFQIATFGTKLTFGGQLFKFVAAVGTVANAVNNVVFAFAGTRAIDTIDHIAVFIRKLLAAVFTLLCSAFLMALGNALFRTKLATGVDTPRLNLKRFIALRTDQFNDAARVIDLTATFKAAKTPLASFMLVFSDMDFLATAQTLRNYAFSAFAAFKFFIEALSRTIFEFLGWGSRVRFATRLANACNGHLNLSRRDYLDFMGGQPGSRNRTFNMVHEAISSPLNYSMRSLNG